MNRYLTFFELHVYCVFCGSVMKCTVHMCGFLEVPGKGKEVASLDLFLCRDIIAWKSGRLFAVGNNKYLKYLAGICMGTCTYLYLWQSHMLHKDHGQDVYKRHSKKVLSVLGMSSNNRFQAFSCQHRIRIAPSFLSHLIWDWNFVLCCLSNICRKNFNIPLGQGRGLDRILIQCCFTSGPNLDGSSSHSLLLSSVWIGKEI